MTIAGFFLIVFLTVSIGLIVLTTPPQKLAKAIQFGIPVTLIGVGALLIFLKRAGLGLPLIAFGMALFARVRSVTRMNSQSPGATSNVRSAALEMILDHDTGEMEGVVLAGAYEGQSLGNLNESDLISLLTELRSDEESVLLLQAYLDRRMPGWRENTDGDFGTGQVGSPGSSAMGKQEAYEILGLDPGAGTAEIRKAHRRLMKGMHPDSGGSTFLAAKINEAKEVLLNGHS